MCNVVRHVVYFTHLINFNCLKSDYMCVVKRSLSRKIMSATQDNVSTALSVQCTEYSRDTQYRNLTVKLIRN